MKTSMEIIWLTPDLSKLGGSEYMVSAFCRLLKSAGIHVHIITRAIHPVWKTVMDKASGPGQVNFAEIHSDNIIDYIHTIDVITARFTISLMQVMPLESFSFDIIRYKEYGFPVCGLEPTDLSNHCWWLPENMQEHIQFLDGLIVMNPYTEIIARNEYHFNKPIQLVSNTLMNDLYKRTDRSYPLSTFGCISRLSAEKGLEYLLGAFSLLSKRYPTATICIWGEGDDHERLLQQTRMLGIADRVHFHGAFHPLEDSLSISDSAEIFISSSLFEGCGIAMLEQAYRGKPLISTMTHGLKWVLGADYPGLIPIADTHSLSRMMEQTLIDPVFRQSLITLAQQRFHSFFSPYQTYNQLISFYTDVLQNNSYENLQYQTKP
ncbi:glycosyltransferase family 4 protein [Chitinophaga flava]|nr:glycosyltransferase family 4 protein [Chitinophaga flava]